MKHEERLSMGLATPAIGFDDFSGLVYYPENKIRHVEVTPITPDNKAWTPESVASTKTLAALCRQYQVVPGSVHGYFFPALGHCMTDNDKQARLNAINLNKSLFAPSGDIGANYIVIHLSDSMVVYDAFETNYDRARKALDHLLPMAEKTGVKIAVENIHQHWAVSHINQILDDYRHPMLGICLDTGHAAIYSSPEDEVTLAGDRLLGFHIHDNDLVSDQHRIPFQGEIDWQAFMTAVYQTNYSGVLTFESYTREDEQETVAGYVQACRLAFDRLLTIDGEAANRSSQ